jgi:hypothetical protein
MNCALEVLAPTSLSATNGIHHGREGRVEEGIAVLRNSAVNWRFMCFRFSKVCGGIDDRCVSERQALSQVRGAEKGVEHPTFTAFLFCEGLHIGHENSRKYKDATLPQNIMSSAAEYDPVILS